MFTETFAANYENTQAQGEDIRIVFREAFPQMDPPPSTAEDICRLVERPNIRAGLEALITEALLQPTKENLFLCYGLQVCDELKEERLAAQPQRALVAAEATEQGRQLQQLRIAALVAAEAAEQGRQLQQLRIATLRALAAQKHAAAKRKKMCFYVMCFYVLFVTILAVSQFVRGMPIEVVERRVELTMLAAYDDKIARIEEEKKSLREELERRERKIKQLEEEKDVLSGIVEAVRNSVRV